MPRAPRHALVWSSEQERYECSTQGQIVRRFQAGDDAALLAWLGEVTSCAFHGRSGSLNVYQERRPRGGRYWYSYHTDRHGIRKRYLGQTAQITLARLEATALVLASAAAPAAVAAASERREVQQPLVLATKLNPPRLPRALVERERLLKTLDGALATPLTLISASAGWGKTTLLSAWASRQSRQKVPIAWLSLDELDNSPTRFWVSVITTLRRTASAASDLGATALAVLQSPQPSPLSACLAVLLQDLETRAGTAQPPPVVVVLDDYQAISDPNIHESLTFWLEHLPAHIHVVLSSRVDPDLPLARLRMRGQLTELRAADLHFRPEEAGTLLQQGIGASLSEEEVEALQRRTEGWAAGLQLAALSLRQQHQDDRSAWIVAWTGSQRYLLDYVQEEILSKQPDEFQRFLLQTAVLARLSAPACQAVLAASEPHTCQRMLEALERANLFLAPLDEERRWYRVHDLFREALLARLAAQEPELVPQLHVRAANWYEAIGELREAIAHALAAPDFARATRLVEQVAPSYWLSGEAQTVQSWVAALPDAVLWQHAQLALKASLRVLESLYNTTETTYASTRPQAEQTLTRLETLLRRHATDSRQPGGSSAAAEGELQIIGRRLRLLRALIEARAVLQRGDKARLEQLAEETERLSQGEDISWRMIALALDFWLTEAFLREGTLLISHLVEAADQADRARDVLASIRVRAWLAHAYLHAAQWPQVERECMAGLALVAESGVCSAWAGYLHSSLAEAYYTWNRLDEAAGELHEELRIAQEWQQVDLLAHSQLNLARIHLAHSDLAAADHALLQAEALVRHERFAFMASMVAAFRVQYWLVMGDLDIVRRWAEHATFSPDSWDPNEFRALLTLARVRLVLGQLPQALDLLERFREPLDQPRNVWRIVEWLAVYVVVLHQAGQREQAHALMARLLALTEPTGNVRVYLDLGKPMRQALHAYCLPRAEQQRLQEQAPATAAFIARLLAAFDDEASGLFRSQMATAPPMPRPARALVPSASDPALTRREQEVLGLLAEGASNQEIARTLLIEVSTVKKHVSNLLSKLGVTSRTQAIAQARARALL